MAQEQVKANTGGDLVVEEAPSSAFSPFWAQAGGHVSQFTRTDGLRPNHSSVDHRTGCWAFSVLIGRKGRCRDTRIAGVAADITEPQALPPPPEPAPVERPAMGAARRDDPKNKEAERQRQMQAGGGTAAIAILAEAVQIEDITVRQRTREGTLSNTIKVASLNLTAVNTRNEPMQLEGALTVLGDGTTPALDIELEGAIRIASDFSTIAVDGLPQRYWERSLNRLPAPSTASSPLHLPRRTSPSTPPSRAAISQGSLAGQHWRARRSNSTYQRRGLTLIRSSPPRYLLPTLQRAPMSLRPNQPLRAPPPVRLCHYLWGPCRTRS